MNINIKSKKAVIGVIALATIISVIYFLTREKKLPFELNDNKDIIVEYGQVAKITFEKLIKTKNYSDEQLKEVKKATKITNNMANEEGKEYPAVGKYKVKLKYDDQTLTKKVIVKDTVKPNIEAPENIDILQGTELKTFDFQSLITAKDLSQLSDISVDYSKVDTDNAGKYDAKITVKDAYNNKAEKQFKITIVAKSQKDNEESVMEIATNPETGKKETKITTRPKSNTSISNNNNTSTNSNSNVQQSHVASYGIASKTTQIIDVQVSGSSGSLTLHNKNSGNWTQVLSTDCRIGKNGATSNKKEGDGKTPIGVFTLGQTFGVAPNPGCTRSYLQVNNNHYWVDDSNSQYYNQLVDVSKTGIQWKSAEHLMAYGTAYKYAIAINYNTSCTPGKGSAIFLHCSTGGATAGCVSIPENIMIQILKNLRNDTLIYIH